MVTSRYENGTYLHLWSPHITIEKAQLEEVEGKLKPSKNLNSMIHGFSGVEMVQLVSEFI
jgi:hypothetical protein